jgi:hypothetical protein
MSERHPPAVVLLDGRDVDVDGLTGHRPGLLDSGDLCPAGGRGEDGALQVVDVIPRHERATSRWYSKKAI